MTGTTYIVIHVVQLIGCLSLEAGRYAGRRGLFSPSTSTDSIDSETESESDILRGECNCVIF